MEVLHEWITLLLCCDWPDSKSEPPKHRWWWFRRWGKYDLISTYNSKVKPCGRTTQFSAGLHCQARNQRRREQSSLGVGCVASALPTFSSTSRSRCVNVIAPVWISSFHHFSSYATPHPHNQAQHYCHQIRNNFFSSPSPSPFFYFLKVFGLFMKKKKRKRRNKTFFPFPLLFIYLFGFVKKKKQFSFLSSFFFFFGLIWEEEATT